EMIPDMRRASPSEVTDEMIEDAGLTRRDVTIPGHLGDDITVSVIARRDHRGFGPGIYHTHGGGMVSGDRFSGLIQVLPWVVEHDAVLVTVDYRLAPEHP
ncbi:alpha/beta hydrolase fold domain-containing protein, partial [Streptomyces sp. SID6648]|nr:alpha/beta hydrolase fold domain-containing protein [Streptomyces sp. SID6648]